MSGKSAILAIKIVADASQAAKELDKVGTKADGSSSKMGKAAAVAGVGLAALATGALDAAKAAAEDQKAQVLLAQALKNSTGATASQIQQTEDWITAQARATGVADDQLRPALSTLARATGDVEQAQSALALALDISAATGKDVGTVSDAMAKAYAGNMTSLGRLVPGIDAATLKSKDMKKITAELARLTGGSAAKAADTAAGRFERMKLALGETKEGIGGALLPALTALSGILLTVANWAQDNSQIFVILLGVLAAVAITVMAVNVALKLQIAYQTAVKIATVAWTAVQWALNAALAANPIGLIVLAIVALIAVIVIAYNKSETFRNIVQTAFRAVADAVRVVWSWLVEKLSPAFSFIGNVGKVVFAGLVAYVRTYIVVIQTVVGWVRNVFAAAFGFLEKAAKPVLAAIALQFNIIKAVIDGVIGAVRKVIDLIKGIHLPSLPSWVPGIGGQSVALPGGVPMIAGTFVRGAPVLTAGTSTRATVSGAGPTINIFGAVDPQGTARQVQRLLQRADVRTGRRRFA